MPRDNDKDNGRPPRRDRGAGGGGKGRGGSGARGRDRDERPARSSAPRGERKFGERKSFSGKDSGFRKSFEGRGGDGERSGRPSARFQRDDRTQRDNRTERSRHLRDQDEREPRKQFGSQDRNSRPARTEDRERSGGRSFGDKRAYASRSRSDEVRTPRFNRDERPSRDDRSPRRGAPDRGPRKDFGAGRDRSDEKPWQKRAPRRDDNRSQEHPRFSRSRNERSDRSFEGDRAPRKYGRPHSDEPREDRKRRDEKASRRTAWEKHPRSMSRDDRPRRDNEDDSKVFAKRPAFGGRGAYRERKTDLDKRSLRDTPLTKKKSGERIAKLVSRAGLCSRRDAEYWITQGRVAVNGRVINSPALDVTSNDVVTIDGKPLPQRERTRLFLYHKPRGLMTTHSDPEGRATVFDNLPEGLPRLISIGRLDFNTEGLLLLTNDGGLARALELPDTGWLRRYRVRAHGEVTQAQLDELKKGVEVDGVKYGSIDATLEHDKGANVWIVFAIREGKNREVRNVMAHLGLEVNRLIRISYGPFQLGEIEEGQVEEIKTRVLRDQLGEKIVAMSGAQFDTPTKDVVEEDESRRSKTKGRVKPAGKSGLIADRKGRRILVTRAGGEEMRTRNEQEARSFGPPRRPTRGYKGKRDIKPKDD